MLEVFAAREIVLRQAKRLPPEETALTPAVLNQVLAADVTADLDSPPFDKSMMDGYAVRSADCRNPNAELRVIEELAAGGVPKKAVGSGEAVRLFTGAVMPNGADAVVKQEDTTADGERVTVRPAVKPGQNVFRRGQEMKAGDVVVSAGAVISPVALGLLAAVGRSTASIIPTPKVNVLVTGNELVEADVKPTGGQIRNTNGPMLTALAAWAGANPKYLGIARDDTAAMTAMVRDGLTSGNVLILSGGVSVGKYDLVPDVLKSLGVEIHFHTVRMKPGKPLLFGTNGDVLVFGLPGNPVSSLVGFELFVKPALTVMRGREVAAKEWKLKLTEPLAANHDRPTYHPAVITQTATDRTVKPLPWSGSADLCGLLAANGFILLPPGEVKYAAGDAVPVLFTHG